MVSILLSVSIALVPMLLFIALHARTLLPLMSSSKVISLTISPNRLDLFHITLIILVFIIKPFLQFIQLVPPLPSTGKPGQNQNTAQLDLQLTMPVHQGRDDLHDYYLATNDKPVVDDSNPIFVLIPLTGPLSLLMFARRSFPLLPIGAVNVRNRFEFLKPGLCRNLSEAKSCYAVSKTQPEMRRVKRGLECDIVVDVYCNLEGFSDPLHIFRKTVTFLQFLKSTRHTPLPMQKLDDTSTTELGMQDKMNMLRIDTFSLDARSPSRWARLSKDYNPIHLSSTVARLFGFKGKIAHGNMAVAHAMHHLTASASNPFAEMWTTSTRPSWLEVDFKRPMVLPIELELVGEINDPPTHQAAFCLEHKSKVFVTGRAGWL